MRSSTAHLPSLLGFLLFTLGAVLTLGVAFILGVITLGGLLVGEPVQASETILLTVIAFEGLLLSGAAYVSIQKFLQKPSADAESFFTLSAWQIGACLLAAGIALLIGHLVIDSEPVNWLLIPLLTLPAVVLPILILFGLGARGIPLGPRWRTWNVLGISMTLVPFVTFLLEALLMILIFFLVGLYVVSQPELVAQMEKLAQQIYLLESDPQALFDLIAPLILRPGVLMLAMLFFSLLVPMLEELIKPLGVWLFANQISSPAQGFALGALSGSAYALIETLGVSPQSADWAGLLLTRIGTGVLHVTTSALMGAGIVYAVREQRYFRLLGIYVLSVFLHGLWNGLAMLFTFSAMADLAGQQDIFVGLITPSAVGMILLGIGFLIILVLANLRLGAKQPENLREELAR